VENVQQNNVISIAEVGDSSTTIFNAIIKIIQGFSHNRLCCSAILLKT